MRINSFRIFNYKSFSDSGQHSLGPNINLVVGQNNVGKTALMQALSLQFMSRPHRDSNMRREDVGSPISQIEFRFVASGQEILDGLLANNWKVSIPIPKKWMKLSAEQCQKKFFDLPEITFVQAYRANSNEAGAFHNAEYPSNSLFSHVDGQQAYSLLLRVVNSAIAQAQTNSDKSDNIGTHVCTLLKNKIYVFQAQRNPASACSHGPNSELASDAGNLGEVLTVLQGTPTAYRKFIGQVRRVLTLVKWVGTRPLRGNQVEIRIWNVEEDTERDDLTVPLSEAGTGIGQVLAILYVVTQSSGKIIIVDEPNSFLHPGAELCAEVGDGMKG